MVNECVNQLKGIVLKNILWKNALFKERVPKRIFLGKRHRDINYYLDIKNQLHPYLDSFKITGIYWLLGVLWIAFPERAIGIFLGQTKIEPWKINLFKGWAFVALSAIPIFFLILQRLKLFEGAVRKLESNLAKQKEIEMELHDMAYYDALTKLPNKAFLEIKCRELIESGKQFAFISMDVDYFKNINDTLGHLAGDLFLKHLAEMMVQVCDKNTFLARLGGDEFAILFTGISDKELVERRVKELIEKLHSSWEYEGKRFYITVSMGIVLYPEQAKNQTMLLQYADIAMYQVKRNRKNSYCFYSEELSETNARKIMLVNELYKAVQNDEFTLVYQPIVDIGSRNLVGVEALIRWNHPEQGVISPLDFIPLAEETGLIEDIEKWVIKTAFYQKKYWDEQEPLHPKLLMSINISGKSFVQYGFVNYIRNLLYQTQINSNEIQLEITETVFIDKGDLAKKVFNDLSSMGIQIALDDFGTGYSSLTYLKNFPVDIVKLDANFIKGIINKGEDRVIVESVIKLTHDLGLSIIAEGIETNLQFEVLKTNHCDFGQGYLYSRPVPPEKINAMLENELLESVYY